VNDHCGWTTVQPSDGLSVPTNQTLTNQQSEPYQQTRSDIVSRTSASMAEATLPCNPAGFDPNSNLEDMNNLSQIKPLAHAGAGGAAGHDAAACVSACSECASACVCNARDASGQWLFFYNPTSRSSTVVPVCKCKCVHQEGRRYQFGHFYTRYAFTLRGFCARINHKPTWGIREADRKNTILYSDLALYMEYPRAYKWKYPRKYDILFHLGLPHEYTYLYFPK